jgi:hypothetical protein
MRKSVAPSQEGSVSLKVKDSGQIHFSWTENIESMTPRLIPRKFKNNPAHFCKEFEKDFQGIDQSQIDKHTERNTKAKRKLDEEVFKKNKK